MNDVEPRSAPEAAGTNTAGPRNAASAPAATNDAQVPPYVDPMPRHVDQAPPQVAIPSHGRLFRNNLGKILGVGFAALFSFSCMGLGFLTIGWVAAHLVYLILGSAFARGGPDHLAMRRSALAGLFFQALGFALLGGLALGVTALEAFGFRADPQAYAVAAPLLSSVGALLLAPLLFAPLVAMDGAMPAPVGASLAAATLAVAHLGLARTARLALSIVVLTIGPFALMAGLTFDGGPVQDLGAVVILASLPLWVLGFGTAAVLITRAYLGVRPAVLAELAAPARLERSVSKPLFAAAALTTLALLVSYAALLVEPLRLEADSYPVHPEMDAAPRQPDIDPDALRDAIELPSGVTIRPRRTGVEIVAPDGGGHGYLPWSATRVSPDGVALLESHDHLHRIGVGTRGDSRLWAEFTVDDDGVRLGDSLGARAQRRIGTVGGVLIFVVLLGWGYFLAFGLPALVRARFVVVASDHAEAAGVPGRHMLEGRLDLAGKPGRVTRGGNAEFPAEAFFVTPDARFRLPEAVPLIRGGGAPATLEDGERVTVFAHFERVTSASLRGIPLLPWPGAAKIARGPASGVADAAVRVAAQRVSLALGATLLAAGAALAFALMLLS